MIAETVELQEGVDAEKTNAVRFAGGEELLRMTVMTARHESGEKTVADRMMTLVPPVVEKKSALRVGEERMMTIAVVAIEATMNVHLVAEVMMMNVLPVAEIMAMNGAVMMMMNVLPVAETMIMNVPPAAETMTTTVVPPAAGMMRMNVPPVVGEMMIVIDAGLMIARRAAETMIGHPGAEGMK